MKGGIRERFGELRAVGIRTVMITGDNPLTAAAIAAEAGVDDFLAEATPEQKLALIRDYQAKGHLVAMTGDGTNDAPALAQADVAVAMNSGTQAAKEAGNMVDLDSNPTKLMAVVEIGKQMLMTRGNLTTFSIANDVAKYFAIIPAAFAGTYPALARDQHHGAALARERRALGGDLQRADHRRADSARAARRALSAGAGGHAAAAQPAQLRPRRRRAAVPVHQADRRGPRRVWAWPEEDSMASLLRPALLLFATLSVLTGLAYPALVTALAQTLLPEPANGSLIRDGERALGSGADRAAVRGSGPLLEPAFGHRAHGVQRRGLDRLEPGAVESGAPRTRCGPASRRCAPPIPGTRLPSRSTS